MYNLTCATSKNNCAIICGGVFIEKEILILGNEQLYEKNFPAEFGDDFSSIKNDLHDTMMAYRRKYKAGRAIAAPQIGIMKRIIYMYIHKPVLFINPELTFPESEKMEVLDDCMSFSGLLVKVMRYKRCRISYYDENWEKQFMDLEGDLSELIQHEYDHLDGILATMRAIDNKSFVLKQLT